MMTETLTRPAPQTSVQSEIPAAILFPGQGLPSQEVCSYYESLKGLLVSQYLSLAQRALDKLHGEGVFKIEQALKDPSSPEFGKTSFVQPLVYTLSVVAYEIMRPGLNRRNLVPKVMAGHSLGEYAALTASGVVPFEKGVEIVTFRGLIMQQASEETPTKLVSMRGLTEAQVRQEICSGNPAEIALINAPNLIVVGCSADKVPAIEQLAKEKGAQRINVLDTAGAFHTSFMQRAASKLEKFLAGYSFANPEYPIVANLTGKPSTSGASLRNHLVEGMVNPVRWADCLETIKGVGVKFFDVETFVESGPGTSLTRLNVLNGIPEEQTINIKDLV